MKVLLTYVVFFNIVVNVFSQQSYSRYDIQDKMENLTHTETDLGTIAQLYRNRQVLDNETSEKYIQLFAIVSCLKHKKYNLYEKHFSESDLAELIEYNLAYKCTACNGKGIITKPCPDCYGAIERYQDENRLLEKGSGLCQRCGGHGNLRRELLTHVVYVKCTDCDCSGNCPTCKGSGVIITKCKKCWGKGKVWNERRVVNSYNHIYSMCIADLDKPRVLKSTVLVEGDAGSGSGVIINFNDKQFVISNMHVLMGNQTVTLTTYEGIKLEYLNIYVSKHQDLILYELDPQTSYPALDIVSDENGIRAVSMGKSVYVYGNSHGSRVVTSLVGSVIGVGPEKIEITAEVVSGNSGSPVIIDKKVAGIATYATPGQRSWVSKNTRFENVRRFALRIDNQNMNNFELLDNELYQNNLILYKEVICLYERLSDMFERRDIDAIINQKKNIEEIIVKINKNTNWSMYKLKSKIERKHNIFSELLQQINENLTINEILAAKEAHNQLVKTVVSKVLNQYFTVCRDNISSSEFWSNPNNAINIKDLISWQIRSVDVSDGIAKATVSITTSLSVNSYSVYLTMKNSEWKIFKLTKIN